MSPKLRTRCTAMPELGQTSKPARQCSEVELREVVCECWKLLLLACAVNVGSRLIARSRRFDLDLFFCSGLGAHQLNKAYVELDCFLPGPVLRQRCLPGKSWMDESGKRMKRKLASQASSQRCTIGKVTAVAVSYMAHCQQQSLRCLQKTWTWHWHAG